MQKQKSRNLGLNQERKFDTGDWEKFVDRLKKLKWIGKILIVGGLRRLFDMFFG